MREETLKDIKEDLERFGDCLVYGLKDPSEYLKYLPNNVDTVVFDEGCLFFIGEKREKFIRLKTRNQFIEVMQKYNRHHSNYLWDSYRGDTCYFPKANSFISYDRAVKLGYLELL